MLFTLFFEYLFYSSKEFRSLIHIDFHRLFYDACCSIFNELSALLTCSFDQLSATACILYHLLSLLSTPFFKFFAIFFSLVASLVSIVSRACFCAICTTRLLPTRVLRDFSCVISRTGLIVSRYWRSSAYGNNVKFYPYDTSLGSSFFTKKLD